MILDTGATQTIIDEQCMASVGFDIAKYPATIPITAGGGTVLVSEWTVPRLTVLGEIQSNCLVLCYNIQNSLKLDGILGLDFLRDRHLTIDFKWGQIELK